MSFANAVLEQKPNFIEGKKKQSSQDIHKCHELARKVNILIK